MRAEIKLSCNALVVGETVPVRELSQRSRNNVDISAVALAVPKGHVISKKCCYANLHNFSQKQST